MSFPVLDTQHSLGWSCTDLTELNLALATWLFLESSERKGNRNRNKILWQSGSRPPIGALDQMAAVLVQVNRVKHGPLPGRGTRCLPVLASAPKL
jgi:hypothetical protein